MAYGFSVPAYDAAYAAYSIAVERAGGRNPYVSEGSSAGSSAVKAGTAQSKSRTAVSKSAGANSRNSSTSGRSFGVVTKSTAGQAGSVRKKSSNNNKSELVRALDKENFSAADLTGEQKKKSNFAYTGTTADKKKGYLDIWSNSRTAATDEKAESAVKYNYKDVSGDIQRAKTSATAGSVVIKAKRKVQEIKRKLANGKGDADELAAALSHAKRMERVAKKKQHHLELEELVEHKQSGLAQEDGSSGMAADMYAAAEERLSDAEYEIDAEQQEAIEQYLEDSGMADSVTAGSYADLGGVLSASMADGTAGMSGISTDSFADLGGVIGGSFADIEGVLSESMANSDVAATDAVSSEALEVLNDLMEEFGSEEQEMLEEMQEQLALMETVDPNMSKEDLKELKMKHRQSERKDIVKADMDYLKNMFENYEKKREKMLDIAKASMAGSGKNAVAGVSISGAGKSVAAGVSIAGATAAVPQLAAPASATEPSIPNIDISI